MVAALGISRSAIQKHVERRSYYPTYMQQVYDTDLDRLLICTDPAKRVWRDALGQIVD